MPEIQRTRVMFTRISGNVIILTFWWKSKKILENVQNDSGENSRRFQGKFNKSFGNLGNLVVRGNVPEDSAEIFEKISGNLNIGLLWKILLVFQILQLDY